MYVNVFVLSIFFMPTLGKISSLDEFMFINEMFEVIQPNNTAVENSSPYYNEIPYKETNYKISEIDRLKSTITNLMPLVQRIEEWKVYRDGIISRYDQTVKMETYMDRMDVTALIEFAKWSVSHGVQSVRDYVEMAHLTLFGLVEKEKLTENFFKQLVDSFEVNSRDSCLNSSVQQMQSAQQFVYYFYNDIIMTELKGLVILEFSWMILRVNGVGNFSTEVNIVYKEFQQRLKRTFNLLQKAIKPANRIVWRCDPPQHQDKITYDQVTQLVQGYLINEVNLSKYAHVKCYDGCDSYREAKRHQCWKTSICQDQRKCFGTFHSCTFISDKANVCLESKDPDRRQYKYVEFVLNDKKVKWYGKTGSCPGKVLEPETWFGGAYWCRYCYCHCYQDEDGWGERYFSLRESLADVRNNKVVTGLRFKKKAGVFHLQIQQGQMLPRATINSSTLEWRPLRLLHVRTAKADEFHRLSFSQRDIDVQDIETDLKNFVVTGVRFSMRGGFSLSLEAKFSKVDLIAGKFESSNPLSYWKTHRYYDRRVLRLKDTRIPIESTKKSIPMLQRSGQIKFGPTGDEVDAAQTTIPFIDIQDVFTNPPIPLSGVGIFYKSREGFGGFIAPRIFTVHLDKLARIPSMV